ncbi:MAG: 3'-5' exonuclease domain-containing protein 2 [Paludibacteraceae bacterium]|nr:3'-5' exonuclease domain-containing protein 2 [Paludibacteraceae bacterium]
MKPNRFAHKIAKDLIQWLPVIRFDGEVYIIDKEEKIEEAIAYLRAQKILGVDTESRPSFKRGVHYPTALVQIATDERCYLFRLSHIGMPQELADIFADNAICKVGLAFKDDINGLRRLRNFKPANCVDLQSIAGRWGILDLGLQKMYAICFGRKISKSQQLTNWENAQLTPEQARYASTDAWATLRIYKELMATEPLPEEEARALKQAELEKQLQHQQEILAAREQANNINTENNIK